jgi:hypothetical protein
VLALEYSSENNTPLRRYLAFFLAFLFGLLSLFRSPSFDQDYYTYFEIFKAIGANGVDLASASVEPLYYYLNFIFHYIEGSVDSLLFVLCFFGLLIKFLIVGRFGLIAIVGFLPLYASSFFIIHELNQTRLAFSLSIFLYFAFSLWQGRAVPGLNWPLLFIAPLVHYSVIALYPLLLIQRTVNKKVLLIFFALCIILLAFLVRSDIETFEKVLPNFLWADDRMRGYLLQIFSNDEGDRLKITAGANLIYLYYFILIRLVADYAVPELKSHTLIVTNQRMVLISFFFFFIFIDFPVLATRFSELFRVLVPFAMSLMFSRLISKSWLSAAVGIAVVTSSTLLNLILYGPAVNPINIYLLHPLGFGRSL